MKKIIAILSIIIIVMLTLKTTDEVIIPSDSIRIRVIANSNNNYDQAIKQLVRNNIEGEITKLLIDAKDIDEARNIINDNLDKINFMVADILENNNYHLDYDVNFGYNLFPEKKYKGVVYEEGIYESLVVTIGGGKGDNWWCVLFPPLCMMESNDEDIEEIEYKSFIKEIIDKYF